MRIVKENVMNIKISILLFGLLYLSGCDRKSNCPSICSMEFRSVTVKFKDHTGNPVVVNGYKVINRRTGLQIQTPPPDTTHFKGIYVVASDSHIMNLSAKGDTIEVSAVYPRTNEQKTTLIVISGGSCNCHITKISGPEEIIFIH